MEDPVSSSIRQSIFSWLNIESQISESILDWQKLVGGFLWYGQPIPLIGAKGIWKPKVLAEFPISITSTADSIYPDKILSDDKILYSYRGTDPQHSDNVGLRNCMKNQVPLIYFHQLRKGRYFVAFPVYIVGDDERNLRFTVSVSNDVNISASNEIAEPELKYFRKYKTREVVQRLHQSGFRERVLRAYMDHCAICNLKHRALLDAAHIIPDNHEDSQPVVSNGVSLCKIHHAAYDQNILGISPDYIINIRKDILEEIDGPMLKHGIQEMESKKLIIPRKGSDRPNKEWLDIRYQGFLSA